LLLVAAAVPAALLSRPWWDGNVGVVDPGRVIRSAQPTSGLPRLIADHRLASILNLRGGSPEDWWYVAEVEAARAHGLDFFDLPLSAGRRPTRRELLLLIDTLAACKYPLLIHCKAGADRTGLASAIYLMVGRSESPRRALRAFTILHSHLPFFGTEHLHEPIDEYAAWLEARALAHNPERFRAWVRNEYRSPDPSDDPPPLTSGPRKQRVARPAPPAPGSPGYRPTG
jgi:protein tyrosine phosphatase (PTP) superfamily phosphohydrolase (DUF442 family)